MGVASLLLIHNPTYIFDCKKTYLEVSTPNHETVSSSLLVEAAAITKREQINSRISSV